MKIDFKCLNCGQEFISHLPEDLRLRLFNMDMIIKADHEFVSPCCHSDLSRIMAKGIIRETNEIQNRQHH